MRNHQDPSNSFMFKALNGQEDAARLRSYVEADLKGILDEFYEHLGRSEIVGLFKGQRDFARLKDAQKRHWTNLFADEI